MSKFGGMSPYPRKFGGGRPRVQAVLEQLNADRGDAYDATDSSTTVYVENMAIARAISAAWGTNERLGNMWAAERMSDDALLRWEKILALAPGPDDDPAVRRGRVKAIFERFGWGSTAAAISVALEEALSGAFVAVEYIPYALAHILVPDGTYPWGVVGDVPWSSNTAHVLVRLQKPIGWSEGSFYEAVANIALILEPILPAWCTFNWYRPGPVYAPITDGPSAAGFYLDDDFNLDNQIFGS